MRTVYPKEDIRMFSDIKCCEVFMDKNENIFLRTKLFSNNSGIAFNAICIDSGSPEFARQNARFRVLGFPKIKFEENLGTVRFRQIYAGNSFMVNGSKDTLIKMIDIVENNGSLFKGAVNINTGEFTQFCDENRVTLVDSTLVI